MEDMVCSSSSNNDRADYKTAPSIQVFKMFFQVSYDRSTGKEIVDASQLLSKECYMKWLSTRKAQPMKPEESFRRALTAHVIGSDGRKPFSIEYEKALLVELRKKRVWPCFVEMDRRVKIGLNGFRSSGFHEANKNAVENNENIFAQAATILSSTTPKASSSITLPQRPPHMMVKQESSRSSNNQTESSSLHPMQVYKSSALSASMPNMRIPNRANAAGFSLDHDPVEPLLSDKGSPKKRNSIHLDHELEDYINQEMKKLRHTKSTGSIPSSLLLTRNHSLAVNNNHLMSYETENDLLNVPDDVFFQTYNPSMK